MKEKFSEQKGPFHRFDPRVKILSLTLISWTIALVESIPLEATALFLASVMITFSRLNLIQVLKRMALVNLFLALLWLTLPWATPGKPLIHVLNLTLATQEGIQETLAITLKSNAILLFTILLLASSPITDITHALSHLGCPNRLVALFFFTWRYIHLIDQEAKRVYGAMKLRGFEPRSNVKTYRSLGHLLSAIFIKSYDAGVMVQRAMALRGFNGQFWLLNHFKIRRRDVVFLCLSVITAVGIIVGDHLIVR